VSYEWYGCRSHNRNQGSSFQAKTSEALVVASCTAMAEKRRLSGLQIVGRRAPKIVRRLTSGHF